MKRITRNIRKYLITGLLVSLPLVITVYLLVLLYSVTDNLFGTLIEWIFGRRIPGAGLVLTVAIVLGVGIVAANVIGRRILNLFEQLFTRIPLVRNIYNAVKQLVDAFTLQDRPGFKQAVLVPFPSEGIWSVGFLTHDAPELLEQVLDLDVVTVFVPTVPNPTTGFFISVPRSSVKPLDVSLEEAFKMMLSAGAIMPNGLGEKADEDGISQQGSAELR